MYSFPLRPSVDVLIVGASSASVSTALALRSSGYSVLVVSDRSYLGEETAGRLVMSDAGMDRSDSMVQQVFPEPGRRVFPAAVKHTLETALLEAGASILYFSRPTAILCDTEGRVVGALLANRTAPFAIRCRAIVDTSNYGIVARLGGVPLSPIRSRPEELILPIVCRSKPEAWAGRLTEAGEPLISGETSKGRLFPFYHLRVPAPDGSGHPASGIHELRAVWVDASLDLCADAPDLPSQEVFAPDGRLSEHFENLDDSTFQPRPGLWLAGGTLPLKTAESRLDRAVALGRHVARLVHASLPGQPTSAQTNFHAITGGTEPGNYRFDEAFLRKQEGRLDLTELVFPSLGTFDVVVAGGGTAGAGAGISASRAGAKTVVLETQAGLGGVGTLGLIATYWFGNRVGFTEELRRKILELDPSHKGTAWHPEVKQGVYHKLLREAGGTAWMGSFAFGVRMKGPEVNGVLVSTPYGCGIVQAGCVVDATGSADIAAAAGARCRVIRGRHAAVQGTGLSPRFIGSRYVNSDHTFVDDNDCEGVTHAFINARAKFPHAFDTSPLVDSRERRQIEGEMELSPLDMLAGRTFPDTLVTAISNFDTHGFTVHPVFAVQPPDEEALQAHVPFRCLLPQEVENVLVTGLGISAHRDALPVIRMQADVQNQGYAAGRAAAMSALRGVGLRSLDIRELQRHLVDDGILEPEILAHEDSFPLADDFIAEAAQKGLSSHLHAAVLFAEAEKSIPHLIARLSETDDLASRLDAALVLGMLGRSEAAPVLLNTLTNSSWDTGWNFTGMGQFGASQSRLDACVMALAASGSPETAAVVAKKTRELDATAEFSHCRAIAIAAARVPSPELADAIRDLLSLPGLSGHAQTDSLAVVRSANEDRNETTTRNLSLREIYLARGLFLSCPEDGFAREILQRYAMDLRGVFARHARAVLSSTIKENKPGPGDFTE